MPRLAFVVVSITALVACHKDNPAFCGLQQNIGKPGCPDAMVGAACETSDDCSSNPGFPVCDPLENGGTCVKCTDTEKGACTGTTPSCENHECVACVDDGDCGQNGVCLLAGDCAAAERIIHAKVDGSDSGDCGAIGNECTLTQALDEVDPTRNVIKLAPGTYRSGGFRIDIDVTLDARSATLQRSNGGPILDISNKTVTILGGTIDGMGGGGLGDGIRCHASATLTMRGTSIIQSDESAIDADMCTLDVGLATIANNSRKLTQLVPAIEARSSSLTVWQTQFRSNRGGGISTTNGTFVIVGNVFSNNGEVASAIGGILISTTASEANRLEFNTIANNQVQISTNSPGIHCSAGIFVARNNIIWANTGGGGGAQIGGTCKHSYSDIGPVGLPIPNPDNNINDDPLFEADFSVKKNSPVKGKADPTSILTGIATKDITGKVRRVPADIGAYQVPDQ